MLSNRDIQVDEAAHVSSDRLRNWLAGQLSPAVAESLEEHLATCEKCALLLETLNPDHNPALEILRNLNVEAAEASTELEQSTTFSGDVVRESGPDEESSRSGLERWELVRPLATGGIGEVWIALDKVLGNRVAVKRLRKETSVFHSLQQRFVYEAMITAQLNHPGIVHVLDLRQEGPDSYYVMTLVEGQTLREAIADFHHELDESGKLVCSRLFALLRDWLSVAKTIACAHSYRILHRDIKSENVVLGEFGQVTVLDWGLAKRIGDEEPLDHQEDIQVREELTADDSTFVTRPGVRLGTPSFMAPEQAASDEQAVNERTDVYGLAAMLFEILTGRPPFVGADVEAVLKAVQSESVISPLLLVACLPQPLCEICLKGLAKQPDDRYESVTAFATAVENWLNRENARLQSEESRQKLFDLSDDLMLIFDRTPAVLWANAAWQRILGWNPDDLVGGLPNALVHPEDIGADEAVLEKLERGEASAGMERRIRGADGRYRWFSWTATPLADEGITCAIGRDIDERLRREREYAALLDGIPDATIVLDRGQEILMVNRRTTELFGYHKDELVGQHIRILLPRRFWKRYLRIGESYMNRASAESFTARDLVARQKNGEELEVALRIRPVESEAGTRYVGSIRKLRNPPGQ